MGDPEMTKYLGGPETPEKIKKRHKGYLDLKKAGNDRMFVILAGVEQTPAGSVGYWKKDWQGRTVWETGWHVLPEFQGQGIATRAMHILIDKVGNLNLHRYMHAFPSVENEASNAICKKLGFKLQGAQQFEYPKDHWMRCNDWRLDLKPGS